MPIPNPFARVADFAVGTPVLVIAPSGCRPDSVESITDDEILLRSGLHFDRLHKTAMLDNGEYAVLTPHSSAVFLKTVRGMNLTACTARVDQATRSYGACQSEATAQELVSELTDLVRLQDRFDEVV
jgi:hypothetical protein